MEKNTGTLRFFVSECRIVPESSWLLELMEVPLRISPVKLCSLSASLFLIQRTEKSLSGAEYKRSSQLTLFNAVPVWSENALAITIAGTNMTNSRIIIAFLNAISLQFICAHLMLNLISVV
jgi:hypothetical protein